jgi:hypothetical protein
MWINSSNLQYFICTSSRCYCILVLLLIKCTVLSITMIYVLCSVQQDDIGAHINVGRTFNHLKMFKEAEDAYLKVLTILCFNMYVKLGYHKVHFKST